MRVLLVEDHMTLLEDLKRHLEAIPAVAVTCAMSQEAALSELRTGSFDLIVCDLKIPATDGNLDAETDHGVSVVTHAHQAYPGTPIIILTAFGTIDHAGSVVEAARKVDIIGDGAIDSLVVYRTKDAVDRTLADIERFAKRLRKTEEIEIREIGAGKMLSSDQRRVIQILARRCNGGLVEAHQMLGGLSGTSTFRVKFTDVNGQFRGLAFVKTGPLEKLRNETDRVHQFVTLMLPPGAAAALHDEVTGGAGGTGAISYQLAEGAESLFDRLKSQPTECASTVETLANKVGRWYEGGQQNKITVRELCDRCGAPTLGELGDLVDAEEYGRIEERQVIARHAVQHRDLHAENVLVIDALGPVLIDFGEVGDAVAGYDAVTLELSILFHPAGAAVRGGWPTLEQARQWDNIENYVAGCPVPEFVRACRQWALSASPSDAAVHACLYANAMRQLKYTDTDKSLALALISCAAARLA